MSHVDGNGRVVRPGRKPGNNVTHCPECGCICKTVRSVQLTRTDRDVTYSCQNADCQHIFSAAITFLRTVQPSRLAIDGQMTRIDPPPVPPAEPRD